MSSRNKLSVVILIIFFSGCGEWSSSRLVKYSQSRLLMGTTVQIDICQDSQDSSKSNKALSMVWKRLEDISWRMNVYDQRSDVSKVNRSNLEPVSIGQDTYYMLRRSVYYNYLTNQAFDITVYPLIILIGNI